MISKEKYIKKYVRDFNLSLYVYNYDCGDLTFGQIFENIKREAKRIYGAKYLNIIKIEDITIEPHDYESTTISVKISFKETNDDKIERIKKEVINAGLAYEKAKQEELDRKIKNEQFEKSIYLKLKKKYD